MQEARRMIARLVASAALLGAAVGLVPGSPASADHCSPANAAAVLNQAFGTDLPAATAPSVHPTPGCSADPFVPDPAVAEAVDARVLYPGVGYVQPTFLDDGSLVANAATLEARLAGNGFNHSITLTRTVTQFGTFYTSPQTWYRIPAGTVTVGGGTIRLTILHAGTVVATSTYAPAGHPVV